jgi:hypothetical protein
MRIRFTATTLGCSALAFGLLAATPALAGDHGPATDAEGRVFEESAPVDTRPEWRPAAPVQGHAPMAHPRMVHPPMAGAPTGHQMPGYDHAGYERAREAWLAECRRNHRGRDRDGGLGGAAIGGVVGGVIGNRVAGRGDRLIGTIAGAAVGAAAGAAIDRADGAGRERDMDFCESYLAQHSGGQGYGYGQPAYGYAYAVPMMMVPVVMQQQAQPCTETIVTEEYVPVTVRRRVAPRPVYRAPAKRVPLAPAGKRVRTN